MGASLAAAGVGCTRMPTEFIMPYVDPPENAVPGRPSFYATASIVNGLAQGVLVESHLGRPTKIEGNPNHPASLGATDVHGQACVLDLYDPDRAKQVTQLGEVREWDEFLLGLTRSLDGLRKQGGEGLFILTDTTTSPAVVSQMSAVLAAFPKTKLHHYDPAGSHSASAGAQLAFGRSMNTYYRLDRADVILSLDSDFLACGPGSTRYAHDYAFRRRVRGSDTAMNRLYVAETAMTSTGGKAEHRLPLRYGDIEAFTRELAAVVGGGASPDGPHAQWIAAVAKDLLAHRGASAVIPGETQSPVVHALAHTINGALGNAGTTVIYTDPIVFGPDATDPVASLRELAGELDAGHVDVLLLLGGNPVYDAPADFEFAQKLAKASTSIHMSLHRNETSALAHWVLPERHFLEDWGDARAFDGTVTILQPLILPLYGGHSRLELLDAFVRQPTRTAYEIVRAYWSSNAKTADFETWWRQSVRSGVVASSALPAITPGRPSTPPAAQVSAASGIDLLFRPDPYLLDGRYANNAWLQELPRPTTKLMWDNAVHLSPRTAKRLGLDNQHHVELKYRGRAVRGSVWISSGQADETAIVHLGYGRTHAGHVGNGPGFNAYPLRFSDALWAGSGAEVHAIGGSYSLATMQMTQRMEHRDMVISEPVGTYQNDPDFAKKRVEIPEKRETLYPMWNYTGYAWGMSIDLTACVDCMACVVACQAENNIPVVGKEQCLFHREMYWLRVDAYYEGDDENPSMRYQPVPCMHCEDAPCELVCPVAATEHSADGLNEMVYNRCIGTRYCSNNCPYKVRRFNFLLYNDWVTEQLKLQRNPDVTVRSRGVMEKCSYCVQRIREAEIRSTDEDRFIRDGEIQTACQQVCPTKAIVFGDINNPANQVAKLKAEKLDYPLLGELNTRPRTTYLAELRNPNPELKENAG
jgi:molybdopterin-containing oxidoreductase family iron-sulfur binding subunit